MALPSTMYTFDIELSDVDRGVYAPFTVRMARHPSESEEYFLVRLLAYCLEYTEGIGFSAGLADADEPALSVRDLTGQLRSWIDIGAPDAARLHRASKAAPRVAVYTHRDPGHLRRQYAGTRIHRADAIEVYAVDPAFLADLGTRVDRRTTFGLSVTDRHLFLTVGGTTLTTAVERHPLSE